MNLKWLFNESMIAISSLGLLIIGTDAATTQNKVQEVTIIGHSGPVIHGRQWVLETDKGPLALSGLTYYVDNERGVGANLINSFKVGTTYCMDIENPGKASDNLVALLEIGPRPEWLVLGGKTKNDATCPVNTEKLRPPSR